MNRTFRNRVHAGEVLAGAVREHRFPEPLVILGIPRGGVAVAAEMARRLGAPLGVIVARKLRAPHQPELAIGAVTASGATYVDQSIVSEAGADERYLAREKELQVGEARRREEAFDGVHRPALEGATVVVVDDGIATGSTAIAALRSVRGAGAARVVLAVPVAHPRAIGLLRNEADDIVCPLVDPGLYAVGQYYLDFRQVEDDEVVRLLRSAHEADPAPAQRNPATIRRDGIALSAVLSLPAGEPPHPCVVFAHGLGSSKESPRNVVIAEALVDAGIAALLFDLSGHGASSRDPRGDAAFIDDIGAAWSWAAGHPAIDRERMGIAGSSLGGVAVIEALRRGFVRPAAMVLRAPPVAPGMLTDLPAGTLIVIGERDPLARTIRATLPPGSSAKIEQVRGAGHLFEEPGALEEAVRLTVDWFVTNIVPAPSPAAGRG